MTSGYRRGSDGKLQLSKSEAIEIRDEFAKARDFWIYDMEANKELLQAALDYLHNTIEGNNYYMSYMDSQNGCRLIIMCGPCNKSLSSYDPFMSHDMGKAHKKSIQQNINKRKADKLAQQEICFKTLNTSKNIYEPNSLEDMLEQCNERILGLQFLYKENVDCRDSSYYYSCQLCNIKRVKKKDMFMHLVDDTSHNRRYMTSKFDYRVLTTEAYDERCMEIEVLEGKVTHSIIDFTQQFETLRKLHGGSLSPVSGPPSPSDRPSPEKALASPPPPLVTNSEAQVDTDGLDEGLSLKKELAVMKLNDAPEMLFQDMDCVELLLHTLQSLNLKMHGFYGRQHYAKGQQFAHKYQRYLHDVHKTLMQVMPRNSS